MDGGEVRIHSVAVQRCDEVVGRREICERRAVALLGWLHWYAV
jgi:hypothetical protein